jgi:aspartate kinase
MALVVQKFGGTSVADPDRIRAVADHVARCIRRGDTVVLVVSAMGKETDDLLHLARQVTASPPGREMDMLITAGERKATAVMCMALDAIGVAAESFTGSQAGFLTDGNHTDAKILEIRPDRIKESLSRGKVPVVGGAQGVSPEHNVTFLGRGGSDTTAVALAKVLGADACELYTDVSGVYTADPRLVPGARKLAQLSFDEMLEMTATGCPKPAMRSVAIAKAYGVPLHVRSAFTWEPGTWVGHPDHEEPDHMEQPLITGVTQDDTEAKVTVSDVPDEPGIAARLFRAMADDGINVDVIVQNTSEHGVTDISFTMPTEDLDRTETLVQELKDLLGAAKVTAEPKVGRVSVVGAGMKSHPGVAAKVFETLADAGINIEMISTSEIRISCIIGDEHLDQAVQVLHDAFELERPVA